MFSKLEAGREKSPILKTYMKKNDKENSESPLTQSRTDNR